MALTAKKVYAILKRQISDMEAKLNSPVRYRGTVATADLLPLNPDIGDMYNIESKSVYGEAGMNVAWNGVVWDTMGAPIDMSLYLTKEEAETVIQRLVTEYFEKNPVKPGATTEQAQQIEQNKTDIASLKKETGSLKEDISTKITKFYASSQGETHLADSDNGKIMDMMLYGKSEQKQYSGKNLFDFHQLKPKNPNITTVTTTEDAIIVSSNAQTFTGAVKIYEECDAFKGKTITISANIVKADNFDAIINFGCGLFYENAWHWKLQKVTDLGARYITVIVPETITKIQFLLNTNDTNVAKANTITVSEYMVEYGSEPTTYEPYTGGIPSPNPDYPQEIKSVVNPTVKVCGKNLLKISDETNSKNGETVNWDRGGILNVSGILSAETYYSNSGTQILSKGIYTFSVHGQFRKTESQDNKSYLFVRRKSDNHYMSVIRIGNGESFKTFTLNEDTEVFIGFVDYETAKNHDEVYYIQIEKGSTPTTYEPYHEQTVTLPYTLNAIPVNSGGNVTIDGQQYIADYVDVERGKLVRMVGEFVQNNQEWRIEKIALSYSVFSAKTPINNIQQNDDILNYCSNYFKCIATNKRYSENTLFINSGYFLIATMPSGTIIDDFLALVKGKLKVFYALANPTEIDLTPEEIAAFKSLATYYPVTNIFINSEQLDGYTVFNYPISMENGWNYVKQQIGDTRDYIYDMDIQSAEAYVNSEYAVALTELEV